MDCYQSGLVFVTASVVALSFATTSFGIVSIAAHATVVLFLVRFQDVLVFASKMIAVAVVIWVSKHVSFSFDQFGVRMYVSIVGKKIFRSAGKLKLAKSKIQKYENRNG